MPEKTVLQKYPESFSIFLFKNGISLKQKSDFNLFQIQVKLRNKSVNSDEGIDQQPGWRPQTPPALPTQTSN